MRRVIAIMTMLVVAHAGVARADDGAGQVKGRALFNEAVKLMADGKLDEACPKLEASLAAYPGIGTRGKLAECYEKQGRIASAWSTYREVAQLAARSGDAAREKIASERAKALEPKLSYLTVDVPTASDPPGLVVRRNGKELDRSHFGLADAVDAGEVVLEASAPGRRSTSAHLTVAVGQSARWQVPVLDLDIASAEPRKDRAAAPPDRASSAGSWRRPVGLALAGVGIAGIAAGSVFGLMAKSGYDGAFDQGRCDRSTNQCDRDGQSAIDDARTKAMISTISFAAGGALLVGGAVLFFTAPSSSSRSAIRVSPTTYAGGAGFVVDGRL